MLLIDSVRAHIQQFLDGAESLDDFEDWLVGASWNIHKIADHELRRFVGSVELRLAEHSEGHMESDALKQELQAMFLYGCPLPANQMPVFSFTLPVAVSTISSTFSEAPSVQSVVMAIQRVPRSETRSAPTRTVTAREALATS